MTVARTSRAEAAARRAARDAAIAGVLETLPSPSPSTVFSVHVSTSELTFVGRMNVDTLQPDFAQLDVVYEPRDVILELRSFKLFVLAFRNELFSYERLTNTVFEMLWAKLEPRSLSVNLACAPRGGTSTVVNRAERREGGTTA
ncbi:MAG: NADPH-dependent 7-cyano-7-deazaguanine reductase [Chloroflexota bacterium]